LLLNRERYLQATELINFEHEMIQEKAAELARGCANSVAVAEQIFHFVRDEIRYAFRVPHDAGQFKASAILRAKMGFCTQKAILFCALARSRGIPAGIYFFDIVDHSLPEKFAELLRTRTMFRHGVPTLFLNGAWRKLDATLDAKLVEKNGLFAVEFSPESDCLMSKKKRDGEKHVAYVNEYGLYGDVSFSLIQHWFSLYYLHLFDVRLEDY